MEIISKFIITIQQISPRDMQKYMYIAIGSMLFFVMGTLYFTYQTSNTLLEKLAALEKTAKTAGAILQNHEEIEKSEARVQAMLEKNKDEDMKSFFESFCKTQQITPQPGWTTSPLPINEKFEEIIIQTVFKGQTTQKLVEFLSALEKEATLKGKILYSKNLHIKRDQAAKTIDFDLTIATIRMKKKEEGLS